MNSSHICEWKPIESLPLFCASIEILLQEIEEQHKFFLRIKENGYKLSDEHLIKIIKHYIGLTDELMFYETQLIKWQEEELHNTKQINDEIDLHLGKLKKSNHIVQFILQFTMNLKSSS